MSEGNARQRKELLQNCEAEEEKATVLNVASGELERESEMLDVVDKIGSEAERILDRADEALERETEDEEAEEIVGDLLRYIICLRFALQVLDLPPGKRVLNEECANIDVTIREGDSQEENEHHSAAGNEKCQQVLGEENAFQKIELLHQHVTSAPASAEVTELEVVDGVSLDAERTAKQADDEASRRCSALQPSRTVFADDNEDDEEEEEVFLPRKLFLFKVEGFKNEERPSNTESGNPDVATPIRHQDSFHSDEATEAAMKEEMNRKIRKFFGF